MTLDRSVSPLIRSKTAAQWSTEDPYLSRGDLGVESDTGKEKVGVGAKWSATSYQPPVDATAPTVVSLTYAATLNTDASAGDIFDVTLTGNAAQKASFAIKSTTGLLVSMTSTSTPNSTSALARSAGSPLMPTATEVRKRPPASSAGL